MHPNRSPDLRSDQSVRSFNEIRRVKTGNRDPDHPQEFLIERGVAEQAHEREKRWIEEALDL